MQGSLDQPPVVVRGSRGRGVWLVVGSLIFVAAGVAMLASGQERIIGVLATGFFGLTAVLGAATVISPPRLEIRPTGILEKALLRTKAYAWTDIYNFQPVMIGMSSRMVGFDYLNPPANKPNLARIKATLGVHGALRAGWEISADKLAGLLNDARERWLGQPDRPPLGAISSPAPLRASPVRRSSWLSIWGSGRANRKSYWIGVGLVVAIAVAVSFLPGSRTGLSGVTTVLFVRLFGGRLQDLGRSPGGSWSSGAS